MTPYIGELYTCSIAELRIRITKVCDHNPNNFDANIFYRNVLVAKAVYSDCGWCITYEFDVSYKFLDRHDSYALELKEMPICSQKAIEANQINIVPCGGLTSQNGNFQPYHQQNTYEGLRVDIDCIIDEIIKRLDNPNFKANELVDKIADSIKEKLFKYDRAEKIMGDL